MKTSIIEKLEKSRYNLLKWTTIGWGLWYGTFILKDVIDNSIIFQIALWVGLLGWIIFIINLLKVLKQQRDLKLLDKKTRAALNDELHQLNMHKSYQFGFLMVVSVTVVFVALTPFLQISAQLVSKIILYFAVLSFLLAGLLYNRD
jgi:magnesium-transporting ATPase (P-type)